MEKKENDSQRWAKRTCRIESEVARWTGKKSCVTIDIGHINYQKPSVPSSDIICGRHSQFCVNLAWLTCERRSAIGSLYSGHGVGKGEICVNRWCLPSSRLVGSPNHPCSDHTILAPAHRIQTHRQAATSPCEEQKRTIIKATPLV